MTGDTLGGRAAIVIAALQSEASERHQEERGELEDLDNEMYEADDNPLMDYYSRGAELEFAYEGGDDY